MHEFFPIAGGILLGILFFTARIRAPWRILLTLLIAACATLGSGEYRLGWTYWLVDLGQVALISASVVLAAILLLRPHRLRR